MVRAAWALVFFLSCGWCAASPSNADGPDSSRPGGAVRLPGEGGLGGSRQVLLVAGDERRPPEATVYALERQERAWRVVLPAMPAVVGRNGLAAGGEKREGDGKTPSGLFELSRTFGYGPEPPGRLPYRRTTADDLWVDDPNSPDYNRWVRRGESAAASFEELRRSDELYAVAAVIEHNTNPVVRGHGSAIFLHVWRGAGRPTAGCVALSRENLAAVLQWLDPGAAPRILLGTRAALDGVLAEVQRGSLP